VPRPEQVRHFPALSDKCVEGLANRIGQRPSVETGLTRPSLIAESESGASQDGFDSTSSAIVVRSPCLGTPRFRREAAHAKPARLHVAGVAERQVSTTDRATEQRSREQHPLAVKGDVARAWPGRWYTQNRRSPSSRTSPSFRARSGGSGCSNGTPYRAATSCPRA